MAEDQAIDHVAEAACEHKRHCDGLQESLAGLENSETQSQQEY